jgi:hypothetical protein
MSSQRSDELAAHLQSALDALLSVIQSASAAQWSAIPSPGEWSVGKEAEHVADGNAYHLFLVRQSLRQRGLKRPGIERSALVTSRTRAEVIELLQQQTSACLGVITSLSANDLALPTRPFRPGAPTIAHLIKGMSNHYHVHRQSIEAKLQQQLPP